MILAELRSLRWADLFMNALIDPRALARQIHRQEPRSFALSFTVPAAASVIGILASSILTRQTPFVYDKLTYGWLLAFIGHAFVCVVAAALMDAASQLFGYRGNVREFVTLVNFSRLPQVFLLPAVYVCKVFHFAPLFFYVLFEIACEVWSAAVAVQGISEMHEAGLGRSAVIYLFPAVLVGGTLLFMAILLGICAASYLAA